MSRTSPHLPIEIWQTILRYAISIPAFLDPDAVAGIPARIVDNISVEWNNAKAYQESEVTRQSLRQVCRPWRSYLQPFEDRYVEMINIRHEKVQPRALKKVIRVSFWGESCSCDMCKSGYVSMSPSQKSESFEEFCWRNIHEQGPLSAEILDLSAAQFNIVKLWKVIDAVPNLVTLSAFNCSWNGYMSQLINYAPNLRHCLGRGFWGSGENEPAFHSTTLQSLYMIIHTPLPQTDLSSENWYLPGLRNLRLAYYRPSDNTQDLPDILCPLLMAIGANLVWLDIASANSDHEIPSLLWALCPHLEYFKTAMKLSNPPPEDHPLRTLSVPMVHGREYHHPPGYSSLFPAWFNLRVLMVKEKWSSSRYLGIYPTWVRKCKQHNIRLVDVHDETLDSYTKRLGIYFDKCGNVCLSSFSVH
jgi:hypothetical protein